MAAAAAAQTGFAIPYIYNIYAYINILKMVGKIFEKYAVKLWNTLQFLAVFFMWNLVIKLSIAFLFFYSL